MMLQTSVTRSEFMLDNNEPPNLGRSLSKDQRYMHLELGMVKDFFLCHNEPN